MGDSITQGRAEFVSVSYPIRLYRNTGAPTINAGVGGVTASYSLRVIDSLLAQHHPSYVLLMYGTNDINDPGKNLQSVAYVVLQAALRAQASGAIPVIGTIPPMVGPRAGDMSKVRSYNSYLRSYAAAYGIRLADIQAAFGSGAGLFVSDGFHPNDAGMEIIARTFGAHIRAGVAPTGRTSPKRLRAGQSSVADDRAVVDCRRQSNRGLRSNPPRHGASARTRNRGLRRGGEPWSGAVGSIVVQDGGIGRPLRVFSQRQARAEDRVRTRDAESGGGRSGRAGPPATNDGVAGSPIGAGGGNATGVRGTDGEGSAPKTGATNTGPFILTNATR
jgi:lysophospholipase L1-like esterase